MRGESAILPRTGQGDCFDASGERIDCKESGQDGASRLGAIWPVPRFQAHALGVLDRLTGLIWAAKADLAGLLDWQGALDSVAQMNLDSMNLDSGARWRLPNINEFESLVDASRAEPALPVGHPFAEVREAYWSSSTSGFETDWAYALYMHKGAVGVGFKPKAEFFCWPVTGPL